MKLATANMLQSHAALKNTCLEVTESVHYAVPFVISPTLIMLSSVYGILQMKNQTIQGYWYLQIHFINKVSMKSFTKKKVPVKYFKDPNLFLHLLYKYFFTCVFIKRTPADKFNYIYLSKLVTKKLIPIQYSVKTTNK